MPNFCNYDMKVVGKIENVKEFIKVLKADYNYNTNEFSFDRHMFRVFSADVYNEDINNNEEYCAYISGDCAWSVETCMKEGGYYRDCFNNHKNNFHATTLDEESKNLNLKIEVFSSEPGCCFQEHYLFDNGDVINDECVEYHEYYIDGYDCKTKEDAEREFDVEFTDDEWRNNEGVICRGGFDWEYSI